MISYEMGLYWMMDRGAIGSIFQVVAILPTSTFWYLLAPLGTVWTKTAQKGTILTVFPQLNRHKKPRSEGPRAKTLPNKNAWVNPLGANG